MIVVSIVRPLTGAEHDAMDDSHSSSSSSSGWRQPTVEWSWTRSRPTREVERHLAVDVCSTRTCFLPQTYVSSVPRPPLLPPPLLPLAAIRRTAACYGDLKLERVRTPVRAYQLLGAHGDEHDVTACFPRHSQSQITQCEEVKVVMICNDSTASNPQADSAAMLPYYQHNQIDATGMVREADDWAAVVSDSSRQLAVGEWSATARQVHGNVPAQLTELSDARPGEVNGTSNDLQSSAVRRRLSPPSRYSWSSTAAQRRTVEFDARYWERRRKNNEAAKRSRDIRRANERRVALRATLLERENARLRSEVAMLTDDALRLHYYLLCSRTFGCSHCNRPASE